jgi:hypothetical protein
MMTGMRRRIAYSLTWLVATCLAVALSWLGVRSVLAESVFSNPGVVAAPAPTAPMVTAPATRSPRAAAPSASPSATREAVASDVHDYSTPGGTAALEVTAASVAVVSTQPNDGFTSQVTTGLDWVRVDFLTSSGAHGWSVIASWYEHAPYIQTASF